MKSSLPNKQSGMTLVEIMVVMSLMTIGILAMVAMNNAQIKANNFLQFQLKRSEIQAAIVGQVLSDPANCQCLFQNANPSPFPDPATNQTLDVTTPPTRIGRYNFVTAGDCTTATIPQPLVDATPIEGVQATSIQLTDMTSTGSGVSGYLSVGLRSSKEVMGPSELRIRIPVSVATAPDGPGSARFVSCSLGQGPATDKTLEIIAAKSSYTAAMMYWFGGGGGAGRSVSSCTGGSFIFGFSGRSGSLIDGLRLHCRNYDGSTGYVANYVGTGSGGPFGLISCPPGALASGIRARAGTRVDRFGLECRDTMSGTVTTTAQAGGFGGSARTFSCPPGAYLFEVRAQHGVELDSLEVVCANLPP